MHFNNDFEIVIHIRSIVWKIDRFHRIISWFARARVYTLFPPRDTYVETHDGKNCVGRAVFADDRCYKREGEAQNKISKNRWLSSLRSFHLRFFQLVSSITYN